MPTTFSTLCLYDAQSDCSNIIANPPGISTSNSTMLNSAIHWTGTGTAIAIPNFLGTALDSRTSSNSSNSIWTGGRGKYREKLQFHVA
ncbi:hypothetical protein DFH05DRAFT_1531239 [Lentinula detonsa]|uniref:Uncharacterized protein n=1 Tax=Lentinula detonsa TaxID=2804962 RepID=A0A9W8TSV4_9AGAR|nr:hypothetical protein DFH05DRAFT_1531254 [Lentinula detonsa]KAJ3738545.1 hypothetical protein DFH05DRAFT_1531266 [Lentinula detonsa]KAJ3738604.1 hypothetical protein DFH05DRAFT_1531239 [Lentinula detonsa]